jgi:twitching motility protein PilU
MGNMQKLFQLMVDKKASDLFFSCGARITIKINGNSMPINASTIDLATIPALLAEVLTPDHVEELDKERELNVRYSVPQLGVFRLSCFFQRGTPAMVVRYIPINVPSIDTLGLPDTLKDIVMEKRGLVFQSKKKLKGLILQWVKGCYGSIVVV